MLTGAGPFFFTSVAFFKELYERKALGHVVSNDNMKKYILKFNPVTYQPMETVGATHGSFL